MKLAPKFLKLALGASALSLLGACAGGMTLAPHLNRERELGPAAAAERYGNVMDKAAAFEQQNLKSRDVHWYRMWRASAMVGMGQHQEAITLVDQVLSDMAASPSAPAQADRLRMFAYDLKGRASLALGRPEQALNELERAFAVANDVDPETRGECDHAMVLTARARQLEEVAVRAGNTSKAANARTALTRQLDRWVKCLAEADYPGLAVMASLAPVLSGEQKAIAVAPVKEAAPAKKEPRRDPPKEPAREEPKPAPKVVEEKPVKAPTGLAALTTVEAQYAPVDPLPWKGAIDASLALAQRHAQNVRGDVVIRIDGGHHALRLKITSPRFDDPADLVPLFRSTVIFFEQARTITPKVERVLVTIEGGAAPIQIVAQRNDVLELFQERLDAASFVKRLVRVM
ncbi:hypothetical protein L6R52_15110 [Myxococcota bacterium]|nr:hypothetical protein [Myxococcota bacterium]